MHLQALETFCSGTVLHNQDATVTMASEATPMGVTVLVLVGVDLIDTQNRFSSSLPGLHPCLATTHNILPNSSFLQFLDVSHAVPGLLALFLVVEQLLLHPKVRNHPAHLTPISSSNTVAILPLVLERVNHGLQT